MILISSLTAFAQPADSTLINTSFLIGEFLPCYGDSAVDYVPSWPNGYFQDANCNTAKWTFVGHLRQPDSTATVVADAPDSLTWNISGALVHDSLIVQFKTYTIDCGWFVPPCNGGHIVEVESHIYNASYARSAISYGQVNNVPDSIPSCLFGPADVTNSGTFWAGELTKFEPYQFITEWGCSTADFNGDYYINTEDLLQMLAWFGGIYVGEE